MTAAAERFIEGVARSMGVDVALLDRSGTTVVADVDRAGSRRVACYQIGRHTLLPCDPAIVGEIGSLESNEMSLTDVDFRSWAASLEASVLGQTVMKGTGPGGSGSSILSFRRICLIGRIGPTSP